MTKVLWAFKQLFPLTYTSKYELDGEPVLSVWKMWMGKVYNHKVYRLK